MTSKSKPACSARDGVADQLARAGLLGHQGVSDARHAAVVPALIACLPASCRPSWLRRPNTMSATATSSDATMKTSMISTPRSNAAA